MKKLVFGIFSTVVVFAGAVTGQAQRGRIDTAIIRERQPRKQRAIDDRADNLVNLDRLERLKPKPPPPPAAAPLRATVELQVIGVEDGDTLIISNTANQRLRLRLQGIDAPETGQAFFNDAKNHLAKLASGKSVAIEFDPQGKPDKEGRVVAKVYLDGNDIALEQVREGLAWFCKGHKKIQSESDRYSYAEAEKEARTASLGLWREHSPRAPWDYRKQ